MLSFCYNIIPTLSLSSGPQDIKLSGVNSSFLKVEGLHIDEAVGSPTHYQFELCVWDYHNLTDTSNVTISYTKSACGHNHFTKLE